MLGSPTAETVATRTMTSYRRFSAASSHPRTSSRTLAACRAFYGSGRVAIGAITGFLDGVARGAHLWMDVWI